MARGRLARPAANGAVLPFGPDANGTVNTLAAVGSTVCVGGGFTGMGGPPRK